MLVLGGWGDVITFYCPVFFQCALDAAMPSISNWQHALDAEYVSTIKHLNVSSNVPHAMILRGGAVVSQACQWMKSI